MFYSNVKFQFVKLPNSRGLKSVLSKNLILSKMCTTFEKKTVVIDEMTNLTVRLSLWWWSLRTSDSWGSAEIIGQEVMFEKGNPLISDCFVV